MTGQDSGTNDNSHTDGMRGLIVSFGLAFIVLLIFGGLMLSPVSSPAGNVSVGETVDVATYDYDGSERVLRLTVVDDGEHAITEIVTSNGSVDTRQRHDIRFTSGQAIGHNDVMGEWGLRLEKTGENEYSWRVNFVPLDDTVAVEYGKE